VSKLQTRKSVSLTRELYHQLVRYAHGRGASVSQVIARGARAVMSGEIELGETVDPQTLGMRTDAARLELAREAAASVKAIVAQALEPVKLSVPVIPFQRPRHATSDAKPFCALCLGDAKPPADATPTWKPRREPFGRDGAMVIVCESCACDVPRERDHLFGGSGPGVGEGNARLGMNGGRTQRMGRR
jgi:hypothetical protein